MKHAVLMTIHNNSAIVKLCMQMLDDPRFTFYLLLDKKSPLEYSEFIPTLQFAKVKELPRIGNNWGGGKLYCCRIGID